MEILRLLLVAVSSCCEIGMRLALSERTVERHISNIYRKIGAHNRGDLEGVGRGLLRAD